jgi:cbb3-type cytochrome oxidase subunit 3
MKNVLNFVGHLLTILFTMVFIGVLSHVLYYIVKFGWNLV